MQSTPDLIHQNFTGENTCSPLDKVVRDRKVEAKPKAIDLFAGAGGFSIGLQVGGFEILGAFDSWAVAVETYAANFNHPVVQIDLSKTSGQDLLAYIGASVDEIDLLVASPPCQGFSMQRIGSDYDIRNQLVMEFARLVTEIQPRLFMMENVPGLLGKRGKSIMAEFTAHLENSGYRFTSRIINAAAFGVPQLRKRVFIVGWRDGQSSFVFPAPILVPTNYQTVFEAFTGLPSPPNDFSPHPDDALHRRTRLSPLNQKRIELIPPGGGMQDLPDGLKVDCHKVGADKIGHRFVYGRLAPDCPSATITARFDSFTRGKFGHPFEARNITLREGARLQSFPDTFRFIGTQEEIASQIGNAVPPLLAESLVRAAANYLKGVPTTKLVSDQLHLFD